MLGDRHVTAGCGMSCYAASYVIICARQRDRIAAVWRSGEQNDMQPRRVSGSDLSASVSDTRPGDQVSSVWHSHAACDGRLPSQYYILYVICYI